MNRSMAVRLGALLVIAALGVYYIAFDAIGVHPFSSPYTVNVDLPRGGGIYSDAAVTYRGVEVGKVTSVHLEPNEVIVKLAIHQGVKIPADSTASVKELTAAAEQYMDIVPPAPSAPAQAPSGQPALTSRTTGFLRNGSTIPMDRTSVPISVGAALDTINTLVNSIHAGDLNTITQSLAQGLQDTGPDLRAIINNSNTLLEALQQSEPQTTQVIDAGHTVLQTLDNTNGDFATFTSSLDQLSQQLVQSNNNLVQLINNGGAASQSVSQLLTNTSNSAAGFFNNFAVVTNTAYQRNAAVAALFQVLPVFANDIAATSTNGNIRFELLFNDQNTVCPYTTQMLTPTSLVATADLTRNCTTSAHDMLQRGAATAPAPAGG